MHSWGIFYKFTSSVDVMDFDADFFALRVEIKPHAFYGSTYELGFSVFG
jgi:hypothetical protein